MSQEVFDAHRPTIETEIRTILAAKGTTRRRFRIAAVYEKAAGTLVAEVFRTSLGPVVLTAATDPNSTVPKFEDVVGYRRDRTRHDLTPVTGDPQQIFMVPGTSRTWTLFGAQIENRHDPSNSLVFRD